MLDGSLPSTFSNHNSTISVSYKLRATAVRSALASNYHAQCPVTVIRSLALDSLEYQQTLEIENTWPEKIMYSLLIPHKVTLSFAHPFIMLTQYLGMGCG